MDFRSPSVNQIADFLLHLFKERNLQPTTIEGYRTAIADMVGNDRLNISKDENLTCLLDSFHRDKPKGINQSINQLSRCLISVSTDSKAHHPIRKA